MPKPASMHRAWPWLVFAAALLAFTNNLDGTFKADDLHHIAENPAIRSLSGIGRLFTDGQTFSASHAIGGYRPVLMTTFALSYALSGAEPWGFHLVQDLLHGLNAALVYLLVHRLLTAWRRRSGAVVDTASVEATAGVAALLFAVHPLQTEAVDYLMARSNVLCTTFVLGATLQYARWRDATSAAAPDPRHLLSPTLLSVLGLGLLALGSKELGLVLVGMLLVLDAALYWPALGRARWLEALVPHAGTAAIAAGFWWVRGAVIAAGRVALPAAPSAVAATPFRTLSTQLLTQAAVVVGYLRSLIAPFDLSYPRPVREIASAADPAFWLPAAVLLLLGAVVVATWRRWPLVGIGLLWAAGAFAPTSLITTLYAQAAERRCYLAMVGVSLAVAAAAYAIFCVPSPRGMAHRRELLAIGALFSAIWTPLTWMRNADWASELSLYEAATKTHPDSAEAWQSYAAMLVDEGRTDEAVDAARRALALDPDDGYPHFVLGAALAAEGRLAEAERELLQALLAPRDVPPFKGRARFKLAEVHEKTGRAAEAEAFYRSQLPAYPDYVPLLVALARVTEARGAFEESIALRERLVVLRGDAFAARAELAIALHAAGRLPEARDAYRTLLAEEPDHVELRYNLALVEEALGDPAAEQSLQAVLAADPSHFQALVHLAALWEVQPPRRGDARALYERLLPLCTDTGCQEKVRARIAALEAG